MGDGASNTVTTLSGLFKEVYAPSLEFLMPKNLRFQNDIGFVPASQQPGNNFNQPVVLQHEHGFTYAAAGAGAFTVADAAPGQIKNAQVVGAQMLLESILDYESAARASSGGKRAFVQSTKYLVENMWQSSRKRLEIDLLYGQVGLGVISNVSTNVFTIDTPEFAPGIWAGMEGASVNAWQAAWAGMRVNAATITAVDLEARTVTVDTAPTSTAATDILIFEGQVTAGPAYNTMAGIHKIMTNAGSLFGIDAATYSLWKANAFAISPSANLSFEAVQKLIARAVGKGADTELVLYVNPSTWATLLSDQAGLRRHGDPNKSTKYTLGSENIEFYSQVGKVTIKASIYVKEGYAYLLSPPKFHRIGATDITFRLPDRGDEFFFHLDNRAGYALRTYSNQAVFSECPGVCGYLSGIDNA
jgi:hypothetical protein